jgi:hypothetical protein
MGKPIKTILGFSQGAIVAAIVAIGLSMAIKSGNIATWITMPLAGILVGIVCGQPIWKEGQWATGVVKGIFGLLLGLGANLLLDYTTSSIHINGSLAVLNLNGATDLIDVTLGNHWIGVALFGGVWGLLVGLDSGFDDSAAGNAAAPAAKPNTKK